MYESSGDISLTTPSSITITSNPVRDDLLAMSLVEFGSQTSLEVDESGSSTSGQESVDLPAPDDRERMSLLEAAVQWIKKEMVSVSARCVYVCGCVRASTRPS